MRFHARVYGISATILILCLMFAICSCGRKGTSQSGSGDSVTFRHARLLHVEKFGNYSVARISNPWKAGETLHTYVLVPRDMPVSDRLPSGTVVKVPLQRAAVFTSVHCGLLSALGRLGSVAGVCDYRYVLLLSVRRHVESGKAKDLGASASPDVERIVSVNPDALLVSPFSGSGTYGKLAGTGVPIIECADYMEHSPLARAEWMRFYGMLFGCSAEADSLFAVVEKNYMSFKKIASVMPRHPKLMCDLMQGAAWYVPGGKSTIGQAFKDAGAEYIFGGNNSAGSVPLSFEAVYDRALNADVWVMRCGMAGVTYASLKKEREAYSHFRPWRERRIYSCNTLEVPFFDESPFRPDYLLGDLVKILYPEKCTDYSFRYFSPVK